METHFLVLGEDCTYFNIELGWVEDKAQADIFPIEILTTPLPRGTVGVLEETVAGEEIRTLVVAPSPGGVLHISKKSV